MSNEVSPRVGEVVAASTATFTAQSYETYELPSLGALVKTKDGGVELYAVPACTPSCTPARRRR